MHDLLDVVEVARWLKKSQEWVLANLQECVALRVAGDPRWTHVEIIRHLRELEEKNAELRKVVAAVQRTGLKGTFTLQLVIEATGDGEHVSMDAKLKSVAPAAPTMSTLFLTTPEGDVEPVQQVLDPQKPTRARH